MRARAMAVAATLGTILALAGACVPASAATPPIEVSRDGSSWSATLPGSVFGDARLVPMDAITRSVFVRNNASSAGYLRVTLRDVTTDNLDFAGALSLRADLAGWPGETVSVSTARPCARLSEGPVIPSGGVARVDLTALLGDLEGQRGQNGSAGFQVVLSLSGQPLDLGPTACPQSGAEVVGYAPVARTGSRFVSGHPGVFFSSTAAGWTSMASTSGPIPSATGPDSTTTTTPPAADGLRVVSNTSRFYQEYDVALWLVAVLLGAAAAWIVLRRRPRAVPEDGHDENGALR